MFTLLTCHCHHSPCHLSAPSKCVHYFSTYMHCTAMGWSYHFSTTSTDSLFSVLTTSLLRMFTISVLTCSAQRGLAACLVVPLLHGVLQQLQKGCSLLHYSEYSRNSVLTCSAQRVWSYHFSTVSTSCTKAAHYFTTQSEHSLFQYSHAVHGDGLAASLVVPLLHGVHQLQEGAAGRGNS